MKYYRLNVAGLERDLPVCPLNEELCIAGFVIFGDPELTVACARDLLAAVPEYDVLITAEAKGIPLAHEMARQRNEERYLVARKATKLYMTDIFKVEVRSITTNRLQTLYLDGKDATLIKGIGRIQGLMVQKGNPKGIKGFEDIVGLRYANRQLGSGTRILFDYLLKSHKIDKESIDGYRNEEFTHTAVAAQIAGGNADCGLGIYSAAQMYDLDFIEIAVEEYDFIVNNDFAGTPAFAAFEEIFKSEELKERMRRMGGYRFG